MQTDESRKLIHTLIFPECAARQDDFAGSEYACQPDELRDPTRRKTNHCAERRLHGAVRNPCRISSFRPYGLFSATCGLALLSLSCALTVCSPVVSASICFCCRAALASN